MLEYAHMVSSLEFYVDALEKWVQFEKTLPGKMHVIDHMPYVGEHQTYFIECAQDDSRTTISKGDMRSMIWLPERQTYRGRFANFHVVAELSWNEEPYYLEVMPEGAQDYTQLRISHV